MGKKGFTLTELIAVIVIVSLVITMASISVSGVQKKIKQKNRENLFASLKIDAKKYISDKDVSIVNIDTLIKEGYTEYDQKVNVGSIQKKVIIDPYPEEDNNEEFPYLNCYYYDSVNEVFKKGIVSTVDYECS